MAGRGDVSRVGRFTLFFARCAFSQHKRCYLVVDDMHFQSALHYMLYEKASEYAVYGWKLGNYSIYVDIHCEAQNYIFIFLQ